jgi:hypothetical protein
MKITIHQFSTGGMHYLPLDEPTALMFLNKGEKRIVCRINNCYDLHCAVMRSKEAGYYLVLGSRVMKELGLKKGSTVHALLKSDHSELQFVLPEELSAVMETDDAARHAFDRLSAGTKRGLAAFVMQVKSMDKKIERSLQIAKKLKEGITSTRQLCSNKEHEPR